MVQMSKDQVERPKPLTIFETKFWYLAFAKATNISGTKIRQIMQELILRVI